MAASDTGLPFFLLLDAFLNNLDFLPNFPWLPISSKIDSESVIVSALQAYLQQPTPNRQRLFGRASL